MYIFYYETKIGKLGIVDTGQGISQILFENYYDNFQIKETENIKNTINQLHEYFEGKRKAFVIPLDIKGTSFQKKVWEELKKIPYSEIRTYQDIAYAIGNPKACRAVGMANNKNPVPIIIPCHRVIGKNGNLTGYAGGISIKKILLQIENLNFC